MNAYLMWRLVAGYYPYLPEVDRALLDLLRAELTGQYNLAAAHWRVWYCRELIGEAYRKGGGRTVVLGSPWLAAVVHL